MATYQTSIEDSDGLIDITLADDCTQFTLVDNSTYGDSSDEGHEIADFADTYRKLVITRPNATTYTYASTEAGLVAGSGDALISGTVSGTTSMVHTFLTTTTISAKYCVTAKVAIVCLTLLKCYQSLVASAVCEIENEWCNDDAICKNKKVLNAMKLRLIIDAVEIAVDKANYDEATHLVNLGKKLCNC
jgi:hypothetical protein